MCCTKGKNQDLLSFLIFEFFIYMNVLFSKRLISINDAFNTLCHDDRGSMIQRSFRNLISKVNVVHW